MSATRCTLLDMPTSLCARVQARSFSVSVGVSDYKASVRPVTNATWADAASPSRHWEFAVNLTGYQAPTDLIVWLPANAPGVEPPNGPSRRVWHEFVPPTAASPLSVVTCDTSLQPSTSVRRGGPSMCKVAMIDAFGDRVKGVVEQFHVSAQYGWVSDMVPSRDHWTGLFKYTPPDTGDGDVVTVMLTASGEAVANGTVALDVTDHPSAASELACRSASWPPTTVLVGDHLNCSIEVRTGPVGSGAAVKGVPADFAVFVSFGGATPKQLPASSLDVIHGGYQLNFSVAAPAVAADGSTPVHGLDVNVTLASDLSAVRGGSLHFDVAHEPFPTDSVLQCAAVERFPLPSASMHPGVSAGLSERDVLVATYETVHCIISGHGTHKALGSFPATTLRAHYAVDAVHGHVSGLLVVAGGRQLEFWCVLVACAVAVGRMYTPDKRVDTCAAVAGTPRAPWHVTTQSQWLLPTAPGLQPTCLVRQRVSLCMHTPHRLPT